MGPKSNVELVSKVARINLDKNYTTLNELGVGDYFGEISLMSKLPATASVHTAANTILVKLDKVPRSIIIYRCSSIDSSRITASVKDPLSNPCRSTETRTSRHYTPC